MSTPPLSPEAQPAVEWLIDTFEDSCRRLGSAKAVDGKYFYDNGYDTVRLALVSAFASLEAEKERLRNESAGWDLVDSQAKQLKAARGILTRVVRAKRFVHAQSCVCVECEDSMKAFADARAFLEGKG